MYTYTPYIAFTFVRHTQSLTIQQNAVGITFSEHFLNQILYNPLQENTECIVNCLEYLQ